MRDHMEFYRSQGRIDALKRLANPTDTQTQVRQKMLAVCAGVTGRLDTVIEAMLYDILANKSLRRSGHLKRRTAAGAQGPIAASHVNLATLGYNPSYQIFIKLCLSD